MRYLALSQVVELHRRLLERTGGAAGIRDLGALESAIAQPKMALADSDFYPTLAEKAAALCFSLVGNHPMRAMSLHMRCVFASRDSDNWSAERDAQRPGASNASPGPLQRKVGLPPVPLITG